MSIRKALGGNLPWPEENPEAIEDGCLAKQHEESKLFAFNITLLHISYSMNVFIFTVRYP